MKYTLSLLTFNTMDMPLASKKHRERVAALVRELSMVGADVVCLQEVWTSKTKKKLIHAMQEAGYAYYAMASNKPRFCGLITFSKHRIVSSSYVSLKPVFNGLNSSLWELPFDKGYLITQIDIKGETIDIYNIHQIADFTGKYKKGSSEGSVALNALEKIGKSITNTDERKSIACGDFNMEPESWLYKVFVETTGVNNLLPLNVRTAIGNLFCTLLTNITYEGYRVDYVFTKNIDAKAVQSAKAMWADPVPDCGLLSDHAGIFVELCV